MKTIILILVSLVVLCSTKSYKDYSLVELTIKTDEVGKKVLDFFDEKKENLDVWSNENLVAGTSQILMNKDQITSLKNKFSVEFESKSLTLKVIVENLQNEINKEMDENNMIMLHEKIHQTNNLDDFHKRYHTNEEIQKFLEDLTVAYPRNTELFKRGKTVEGREIYGIRIFGNNDNGNFNVKKKSIFFNAGLHAREWIAPATVLYIAHQILKNNVEKTNNVDKWLNNVNLHILPNLNPDGYHHGWTKDRFWRKNRLRNRDGSFGVDLNRNFPWAFGGSGSSGVPSSDIYRGPAPLSEAETQVVAEYLREYKDSIVLGIDYHSYGSYILRPWDYQSTPSPDEATLLRVGANVQQAIRSVNGLSFSNVRGAQMYVHSGGLLDFFYGTNKITGYCLELRGNSFVIDPSNIVLSGKENYAGFLKFLEHVNSLNKA